MNRLVIPSSGVDIQSLDAVHVPGAQGEKGPTGPLGPQGVQRDPGIEGGETLQGHQSQAGQLP